MSVPKSDSRGRGLTGDEPQAHALLGYMNRCSEERWCAGGLIGLHTEMARINDPAFDWLVEQAGGRSWRSGGADDVVFQPGSLAELRGT